MHVLDWLMYFTTSIFTGGEFCCDTEDTDKKMCILSVLQVNFVMIEKLKRRCAKEHIGSLVFFLFHYFFPGGLNPPPINTLVYAY